ncbi:MAG: exopolysaccharide biosynthesis polyprenyl glycosylphosphotransferase [Chloroflexi bacterium]|nr:MAG: exopolysaccharide biosynthesis polyprenyl glycosylphosphotransferase [Chloroflexota bacterium]
MIQTRAQVAALPLRRRRGLLVSERRLLLIATDVAAVALAYITAFNLRTAQVREVGFYLPRSGTVICVAVWLGAARLMDAYDLRTAASVRATLHVVGGSLMLTLAGLMVVFFVMPYRVTRPTVLLWLPVAAVTVTVGRLIYRRTLQSAALAQPIALVATGEVLEHIWPDVRDHAATLYRVRGLVDPTKPEAAAKLTELAISGHVSQVVLGVREDVSRELFRVLLRCYDTGVTVRSLADVYEELTGRLLLDQLGHAWLISLPMRSETSRLYAVCKRSIDIVAATAGLLALALILPAVSLATKLSGRGPVFHRQTRIGKYGRPFTLWKLRTMRSSLEDGGEWARRGDPRVTPVGRVLRKLHLDELPQTWAILRGDMSLVGPRPEQPHYVEELRRQIDFYDTRLTVRPGLTGWAQVSYGYGSGLDGTRVKLSYDLYYVKRQSLSLDLLIMGRTLKSVLSLSGR